MRIREVYPENSQLAERVQSIHRWLAERIRARLMKKMEKHVPMNADVYEYEEEDGTCRDMD